MKRPAVLLVFLALVACAEGPEASVELASRSASVFEEDERGSDPLDQARRVTPTELKRLVDAGDVVIVDVRNATQWEAGHIEGALHIPSGEVFQRAGELPRDKWIAFYCT